MKNRLCLPWSLLVGLFLLTSTAEAARATTLILGKSKPEPKIDTLPTGEENLSLSAPSSSNLTNVTTPVSNSSKLTGVPQIDYILDPNLPRELNGYNLTEYPFYNSIPEDIDFKCDGLHDGFYASVPHKCQVYHHCLFGTRYDFLCANYTAFDQKTFICHFASEVDCKNSPKYYKRNEALYKPAATTTSAPSLLPSGPGGKRPQQDTHGRRRRPMRRRKPQYEYYDDYEDYQAEQDYYDDESRGRRKRPRPYNKSKNEETDGYSDAEESSPGMEKPLPTGPNKSLYDRPRVAPKIRRPVPVNERDKYDYNGDSRVIPSKEPAAEKPKHDDESDSNSKKQGSHRPDEKESSVSGSSKNREQDGKRSEADKDRDDYDRDSYRERDRDSDRPLRERRPPKKRRRPDGANPITPQPYSDDYDEDDDGRSRPLNRGRPRYEDDDYEYDDRPYRRNRDPDYRSRDHDYDRDKNYRDREYDRPSRNRDRSRDDDRPSRNRDMERERDRNRDDDRDDRRHRDDSRERDRHRDYDRERERERDRYRDDERDDDRTRHREEDRERNRNKEEERDRQKNRDDDRRDHEDRSREVEDRPNGKGKTGKNRNKDERLEKDSSREESAERPTKQKELEIKKQEADKPLKIQPRNPDRPSRFRESSEKGRNSQEVQTETDVEPETKTRTKGFDSAEKTQYKNQESGERTPARGQDSAERTQVKSQDSAERTRTTDRINSRPRATQRTRVPPTPFSSKETSQEEYDDDKPVPASRPAYITNPENLKPTRKPAVEFTTRKPSSFKRPYSARVVPTEENVDKQDKIKKPNTEIRPQVQQQLPPLQPRPQQQPTQQPQSHHTQQQQQPPQLQPQPTPDIGDYYDEEISDRPEQEENRDTEKVKNEESVKRPETKNSRPFSFDKTVESPIAEDPVPPKLKVPFEEPIEGEELAPRAPKLPKMSIRRRPFLPSRGGNPSLPRGLNPVGGKAVKLDKKLPEEFKSEVNPPNFKNERPTGSGIEFRAKVTASIGVEQPKLTQLYPESSLEQPDESLDVSAPASDDGDYAPNRQSDEKNYYDQYRPNAEQPSEAPDYPQENRGPQGFKEPEKPYINFRPTLKTTDFPHLKDDYSSESSPEEKIHRNPQHTNSNPNSPLGHYITKAPFLFVPPPPQQQPHHQQQQQHHQQQQQQQQQQQKQQQAPQIPTVIHQHLGPQTFYSENPKFKTTLTVPEHLGPKPTASNVNYNAATHLPIYQQGLRKPENEETPRSKDYHKNIHFKFPQHQDSLDDTDEYDVSLNDALQPISTLHPRNVQTGIFLTNRPQSVGYNRRHQEANAQDDSSEKRYESRNVPVQNGQKFVAQRHAASSLQQRYVVPPFYQPQSLRPFNNAGKYYAIFTK